MTQNPNGGEGESREEREGCEGWIGETPPDTLRI